MFGSREQFAERHVIIPDVHGEFEALERIIDAYYDVADVGFVFLGDIVDRKIGGRIDPERGVYRSVQVIKDLGERAVVTIGNHEHVMLNAFYNNSPDHRMDAANMWLGYGQRTKRYENHVLSSYGVEPTTSSTETANLLHEAMCNVGHIAVFTQVVPYYETESFIATHAGIENGLDWEMQKDYLHDTTLLMRRGNFNEEPIQWFDPSYKLSTDTTRLTSTNKIVLSGHAPHITENERFLHNGHHVRLATRWNAPYNEPVYVWQDWDEKVVTIDRK